MADFGSIVRSAKVFEHGVAQIHADVQTYSSKSLTMVHITNDRKLLDHYMSDLKEFVLKLGEAATDDKDIKEAGALCNQLRKYIKETTLRLDGYENIINPPSKATVVASKTSTPQVKLPKLDLPTFDGKYEGWMSFRDRFTASIVKNTSLSGSERLEYLNTAVKGEAERLIKSFPITDSNFDEAWALMCNRYENNRELVFSLLKTFFSQPKLTTENLSSLRKLVDVSLQCQRSLEVLKRPVDQWDDMLVYTVVDKLDNVSKREWAKSLTGSDMPTFKELVDFLENHIRGLHFSGSKPSHSGGGATARAAHHLSSTPKCPCCDQAHALHSCSSFRALSPKERALVVKSKHLCYNCLSPNHGVSSCESKFTCRHCHKKHHSMLHFESTGGGQNVKPPANTAGVPNPQAASPEANMQRSSEQSSSFSSPFNVASHYSKVNGILLATAEVEVQDSSGYLQPCRVFLDPGSESSFMTDKCATRLGLKRKKCDVKITGISSSSVGRASSVISCTVRSKVRNFMANINALVLTKVTGDLPSFSTGGAQTWAHLQGLTLADPQYLLPREVDILLGADVTERIFLDGRIVGGISEPIARNSEFGWIIMGPVGMQHEQSSSSFISIRAHATTTEMDFSIKKFWEIEEVPHHPQLTEEEKFCESHFTKHHSRDNHGRYIVPLPYNNQLKDLGSSRDMAERRLLQLEKRFTKNPTHRAEYIKFLREYESLGHMHPIPQEDCGENVGVTNYLPHHFVLKDDSSTTKLRVVFDGSAATSTGISLNNCLCVGPTIQEDLFSLLCRFRLYPVALKSDVAKMYRQFLVPPEDQDRQRILWRESPEKPIKEYRLNTVTYGTASAPFAATRCLQQLANDEGDHYPLAKRVASDSFYVDDLIGGEQSTSEAQSVQQELTQLMSKACLELRKWDSNDPNVLQNIDSNLVDHNGRFNSKDAITKALGVQWNSVNDTLLFSAYQPKPLARITKRTLLSEMSKIFDPLGWLAPVIISIKCFFQELWMPVDTPGGQLTLSWDDDIPSHLIPRWLQYQEDVSAIRHISIPRLCLPPGHVNVEIHGFSDASETAYCACVYLRSFFPDGSITSRLLTAKTKVAPLKFLSIPRMELCAALLLSRLLSVVTTAIKLPAPTYAWTDSEITLRWLSSSSRRWKVFVANRVAEIQEIIPAESWHFTPGEINPADCGTRGYKATDLVNCTLWWQGPLWMNSNGVPIFTSSNSLDGMDMEERPVKSFMVEVNPEFPLLNKYSCFSKLNRVTAYILRFVFNCRSRNHTSRLFGELSVQELQLSYRCLVRISQKDFNQEISSLTLGKRIKSTSKLLSLNPFVDADGILRVGGRLQRAPLEQSNKHQIILSYNNPLTKLIIWHSHVKLHHGGFKLIITTLCRDFWILRGRNTIKQVLRTCLLCKRLKAATAAQLMGSLPSDRVTPGVPFQKCGVDYAGPFTIQSRAGRGQKQFKAYFCVFVCFAVKAVHLESVTDLSTAAFLAALKRFTARRGAPSDIYSDCGTNFTGADKELQQLVRSSNHNNALFRVLAGEGIQWHFLPPSAPHQGGLWEAAVKSVKYHLKRIIGSTTVTFEEFTTILCQAEAVLNSRPLGPMSSNPEDHDVLTPAHFLIGRPITALPEPDRTLSKVNRLSRWETCQQITQHLWKRWHLEYLNFLQERSKWRKEFSNVKVGDLVLIKDENCGPLQWKRGRIIATHPGPDGLVRAVTLKTRTGEFERPIVKICPLLSVEEE